MPMTIDGLELFMDKFSGQIMNAAKHSVAAALYQFGEEIMADSKAVVPVDTGALMSTGKVTLPTEDGGGVIEVTVGYGDESAPYALYVHEELNAPSGGAVNWTRPGSGPKYLENPAVAKAPQLPDRIKHALLEAFSG